MRYESSEKPELCPNCGLKRVAEIQWGSPQFTDQLYRAISSGRITLGSAQKPDDPPKWKCTICNTEIHKEKG